MASPSCLAESSSRAFRVSRHAVRDDLFCWKNLQFHFTLLDDFSNVPTLPAWCIQSVRVLAEAGEMVQLYCPCWWGMCAEEALASVSAGRQSLISMASMSNGCFPCWEGNRDLEGLLHLYCLPGEPKCGSVTVLHGAIGCNWLQACLGVHCGQGGVLESRGCGCKPIPRARPLSACWGDWLWLAAPTSHPTASGEAAAQPWGARPPGTGVLLGLPETSVSLYTNTHENLWVFWKGVLAHTPVTDKNKKYLRDLKVRWNAVGSQLGWHNTRLICPAKCCSLVQWDLSSPGVYMRFGGLQLQHFFFPCCY